MFTKYFTYKTKQKIDRKVSQDSRSAREELGTWEVEINWNNCLLQQWICHKYYRYSQQNHFTGSTIASLNQSLHFRLMWNHDFLDLQQIFALQPRKTWQHFPFASQNMKACSYYLNRIRLDLDSDNSCCIRKYIDISIVLILIVSLTA